jgi:hypothetical protein
VAWILGLDITDSLGLLSRRRACALGLRLLARFLVFAAATLRRLLVCQGDLPAIASPDSADYPVESTRARTRLSRPSKAALVPARQGKWSFACSATLRWVPDAFRYTAAPAALWRVDATPKLRSFLLDRGRLTRIDAPDRCDTAALGLNDRSQIVIAAPGTTDGSTCPPQGGGS